MLTSLLKCLCQAREMSGHVFVLRHQFCLCVYDFDISYWNCSESVVLFVFNFINTTIDVFKIHNIQNRSI